MMEERIISRKNPLLKKVRKLLQSRSYREETGLFVSDGLKLLGEAIRWRPDLETVILSDGLEAPELPAGVRLVRIPTDVMESLSPMEAPQGALFLCRIGASAPLHPETGALILDAIQDPGNLGTILRTADALRVPVILTDGCADPYSWKTVRASMGAVLRTPPVTATWEEIRARFQCAGIPLAAAALSSRAVDIRTVSVEKYAVILGNEGQGVRRELLDASAREILIPMDVRCESLNVAAAAAIVLWEMARNHIS